MLFCFNLAEVFQIGIDTSLMNAIHRETHSEMKRKYDF